MSTPDKHPDEAAFLAAIAADPDDDTARLVFADWLNERGDPRSAWVRDADVWEFMKPDARDPIPGILEALPALPPYSDESNAHDWDRHAKAECALAKLDSTCLPAVRQWYHEHLERWPARAVQKFVAAHRPDKLQSVRTLKQKLKAESWAEVWFAVVDLGFHGTAASSAVTALTKLASSWDRWTELYDSEVTNEEQPIENAVIRTLAQIGPAALKAVPWLASVLWIYEEPVAEALIKLRADPDVIVDNINTDESHEVEAGIHSILELADDPVAFLVRNAQRHTGRVAYMSLALLAEMGPKAAAALPALQDLANNRTEWDAEYVRGAAEQAIAAINSGT